MRGVRSLWWLGFTIGVACGGETVIATNNELGGAAGSSGASSGGVAGSPIQEAGAAGALPACTPGETQTLGACEQCGTKTRTCDESGQWEASVCGTKGECAPGEVITGGCPDPCEAQICGDDCKPGACQLKPGAECKWEEGKVPHCCGIDQWQFCSKTTCQYFSCQPCSNIWCFSEC